MIISLVSTTLFNSRIIGAPLMHDGTR